MPRFLRSLWPLLALIAIAAAGCSKPEDAYVGHYTGKIVLSQKTITQLGAMASKVQDEIAKSTLTMDLKKDKTFQTNTNSVGQTSSSTGTWSIAGSQIALNATSSIANGKSIPIPANQQSVKFNVSADKKTLSPDMSAVPGAAESGTTITFTKS